MNKYILELEIIMIGVWHELVFSVSAWVSPKKLINYLLFSCLRLIVYFYWSRDGLNLGKGLDCRPNASMNAKDAVFYDCSQWQLIEDPVDLIPYREWVINVFLELERTLIPKPHELINPSILMRPPQQEDIFRVL